ncbi:MAG: YgcG family protein, partial [Desulfobacterium sp.]|nr:YgcG family protein [Desulfobacterium sp.]
MKKSILFLFISAMLLTASIAASLDIPYLTGRVTDNAQILSAETRKALTESLKAHESRTSNQIAILTAPTLNGESIEDYAVDVFEEWKLGQKGKDNGILIIVAPNDRRMR